MKSRRSSKTGRTESLSSLRSSTGSTGKVHSNKGAVVSQQKQKDDLNEESLESDNEIASSAISLRSRISNDSIVSAKPPAASSLIGQQRRDSASSSPTHFVSIVSKPEHSEPKNKKHRKTEAKDAKELTSGVQ